MHGFLNALSVNEQLRFSLASLHGSYTQEDLNTAHKHITDLLDNGATLDVDYDPMNVPHEMFWTSKNIPAVISKRLRSLGGAIQEKEHTE